MSLGVKKSWTEMFKKIFLIPLLCGLVVFHFLHKTICYPFYYIFLWCYDSFRLAIEINNKHIAWLKDKIKQIKDA